tara:strand:+ start:73 stop:417 length:345 start_codon:yes stop_codon:yes gene_type:complete
MFKGLGQLGDMAKIMKQAQEMQSKMSDAQGRLDELEVVGESGAGLVKVRSTAKGNIVGIDIDPTILQPSEKEVIEDLILAALTDAQTRASAREKEEMAQLTEGLGLPPGMKLPF